MKSQEKAVWSSLTSNNFTVGNVLAMINAKGKKKPLDFFQSHFLTADVLDEDLLTIFMNIQLTLMKWSLS